MLGIVFDAATFAFIAAFATAALVLVSVFDGVFDADHDGPFSVSLLLALLVGFGTVGWVTMTYAHLSPAYATVAGLGGGGASGALVWLFSHALKRYETTASFKRESLVGQSAIVVDAIPARGTGRVRLIEPGGGSVTLTAHVPWNARAIAQGERVTITDVVAGELFVTRTIN